MEVGVGGAIHPQTLLSELDADQDLDVKLLIPANELQCIHGTLRIDRGPGKLERLLLHNLIMVVCGYLHVRVSSLVAIVAHTGRPYLRQLHLVHLERLFFAIF